MGTRLLVPARSSAMGHPGVPTGGEPAGQSGEKAWVELTEQSRYVTIDKVFGDQRQPGFVVLAVGARSLHKHSLVVTFRSKGVSQ